MEPEVKILTDAMYYISKAIQKLEQASPCLRWERTLQKRTEDIREKAERCWEAVLDLIVYLKGIEEGEENADD